MISLNVWLRKTEHRTTSPISSFLLGIVLTKIIGWWICCCCCDWWGWHRLCSLPSKKGLVIKELERSLHWSQLTETERGARSFMWHMLLDYVLFEISHFSKRAYKYAHTLYMSSHTFTLCPWCKTNYIKLTLGSPNRPKLTHTTHIHTHTHTHTHSCTQTQP